MIGGYLRQMRKRSGMAVPDVLERLGLARPTLYLWESPRSKIDPVDIRRLLSLYGCTEAEIAEAQRLRSLPVAAELDAAARRSA